MNNKEEAICLALQSRMLALARKTFVGATLYGSKLIITGFNMENRCQKGIHAEEAAVIQAQLHCHEPDEFDGMIVSFSNKDISQLTFCCGHCRQVLWEYTFNPKFLITEVDLEGNIIAEKTLGELYPNPYPLKEYALVIGEDKK
jgi:cytidine deaminase